MYNALAVRYKDQKQAWSPIQRQSVQEWYETVVTTRLHNNSQQLITLTRWHEDDLAGWLLKNEPDQWEVVCFPAIKKGPPLPYDPRKEGEALWPEVHSLERMLDIEKRNPFVFSAMYQQDPKPAEGLLFPEGNLNYFSYEEIKGIEFESIIAASDVADEGKDFYSMPIAGIKDKKLYILDVAFTQEDVDVTGPKTVDLFLKWRVIKARIEGNAGGTIFAKYIKEKLKTATELEVKHTSANKETKIRMASGLIIESCYFLRTPPHPEYAEFMKALTNYLAKGGNKHDDAPDSLTMLVEMVNPDIQPVEVAVLTKQIPKKPIRAFMSRFGMFPKGKRDKWD